MGDVQLTQLEADALIAIEKQHEVNDAANDNSPALPDLGGKLCVPLLCVNKREKFSLDITRGRIDLKKETRQLRGRQAIVLLRLDVGGSPHRNPDDTEISCPHLHIYREGFHHKWAIPIPSGVFQNIDDSWQTLHDFAKYANITSLPTFERGLFT